MYNISDRGASVHKNSAKSLYGLIWKPLEKDLAGVNKIYFSPSGLLHRLNMDAVPVDQDLILSEKYQLIELNSTRQLVFPHINDVKNNLAVLYGGLLLILTARFPMMNCNMLPAMNYQILLISLQADQEVGIIFWGLSVRSIL
ncbi:MAG: CHAT domain-containing protein [Saprospiraceae bacterium]|nr:CHAT domain-containing protein [Candidatus Vicinibacter affinis]